MFCHYKSDKKFLYYKKKKQMRYTLEIPPSFMAARIMLLHNELEPNQNKTNFVKELVVIS